ARVGFDWAEARDVLAKIREEIGELEAEITASAVAVAQSAEQSRSFKRCDKDFLEDELGDVFFAVANLARKLDIDPESALRRTNRKFERRFRGIEATLAKQGRNLSDASLDEMERIWNAIKAEEKASA
ncbi:MAG: MazG nucleotide pyrophosphohydrolase domain-containing protein, partial [Alphaproteobacteria bacterium]